MREEINDLKGSMEKMIEMLQALTTKKEPLMHIVMSEVACISFEPSRPPKFNTTWPEFSLPPNYSPPLNEASVIGLSTQHVVQLPAVPEMQPPHVVHGMAPRPVDDHCYAYYDVGSNNDDQKEKGQLIKKKYQTLEKRVEVIEGNNIFVVAVIDMCLVTDLVIPAKFKTPDFEKYEVHTCPKIHLMMYF